MYFFIIMAEQDENLEELDEAKQASKDRDAPKDAEPVNEADATVVESVENDTLDLQSNSQQTSGDSEPEIFDSPHFDDAEFRADDSFDKFALGNLSFNTKSIKPVELTALQFEISNRAPLEDVSRDAPELDSLSFASNVSLLPILISIVDDTAPAPPTPPAQPVFEMTPPEPSYAVLSALTASGTLGNDVINGLLAQANVIDGLDGDDTITGGNSTDQLWGGAGDDDLNGGDGDDRMVGFTGNDQLTGGDGDDWLWGGDGNDTLLGNSGNDFLSGNAGNDLLSGSVGSDIIYGGADDDTIYALDNNPDNKADLNYANLIFGGDGDDTIYGSSGDDTLNGGVGNDTLYSRSGAGDSYEDFVMGLNPIVYYRLGEDIGSNTAIDKAGNLNASYDGLNIQKEQGAFNNALEDTAVRFIGLNDQSVLSADSAIFDTTEGTVSAWFNVDNLDNDYAVFSKDGNSDVDGQFYVGVDSNGDIYGRLQNGGSENHFAYDPTAAIGDKVQAGQWYMLTMTYGAGGADFYVNGQLVGSDPLLTRTNSDRGFMIGGQNSGANQVRDEFQGTIDEVFWLPDELDSAAVSGLFTAGATAALDTQNTTQLIGGDGNDMLNGGDGLDALYGGDGLDQLFGGGGADQFIFEADSAFNDVDTIQDFNESDGDIIDISDVLSGINVNAGNISDYVDVSIGGNDNYVDYISALNPIVYYRLDESSGNVATDVTGTLDGIYTGSSPLFGQAGFNTNVSNEAIGFDGTSDEVVLTADSSIFDTSEGTVSAWFNVDNMSRDHAVFSKDGNGDVDGQFYVGVDSNGDIYGRLQQGGTFSNLSFDPTAAIGDKIQAGDWYMLTMTYDSGGADFYVNGQWVGSDALLTQTNSDRGFMIGGQNSSSSSVRDEFEGSIDEVFWLGNEMDSADVGALYNAGVSALDNGGLSNGVYVDVNGTGTFNAGNQVAALDSIANISDELTMFNNGNLIV